MTLNKKGSVDDIFMLVIVTFIIGISILFGWVFLSKINIELQANPSISTEGKNILTENTDRYVTLFDGIFLTIFVILAFGILFLAYNIQTSPVFYPIILFMFVALIFVTAVAGNTYYDIASSPTLSSYADDFTIMPFVFNHFVETIVAFGFLTLVVMYARLRDG